MRLHNDESQFQIWLSNTTNFTLMVSANLIPLKPLLELAGLTTDGCSTLSPNINENKNIPLLHTWRWN